LARPSVPGSSRTPAILDPALTGWLHRVLPGQRVIAATPLGGGYRNRNTLIAASGGHGYVLRQYGLAEAASASDPVAAPGARTCAVEAALAQRLRGVVPVPEVVAADPAGSAAGQPVLLSRHVPGVPLSAALAESGEADQARLGHAAGQALAALGTISFGRGGFFADETLEPSSADLSAGLPEFLEQCLAAGPAASVLSSAELAGLRALARRAAPLAAQVAGARQLVHADFNPKNLLASSQDGRWSITAVLDWEFAFSGSPMHDVGNMLRFAAELPAAFADGFTEGFCAAGGTLPPHWREVSRALDLFALADLLTRPADHRYFGRAVTAVRARLGHPG
jgi:aminoglycoside phosphotransferase (APT) family kinase protein